jgi:glycosyltransferase involved in cell wall biosynthesis
VGVYPAGRRRAEVRAELAVRDDACVFLCFGKLRPDKSVPLLLEAFCSIADDRLTLIVAGGVEDAALRRRLEEAAATDSRIRVWLEFVPHERVRELFEASDVAVFSRSEEWTSGSLILALTLGLPAVAARLPPYDEQLGWGQAGWLFEPGNVESLRAALVDAASDPLRVAKGAAALEQAAALSTWSDIAASTAALLWSAMDGSRRPPVSL